MRASEGLITSTFSDQMACKVGAYYLQVNLSGIVCRWWFVSPFLSFFPSVLDVSLNSRCNHWQLSSHWSLRICDTSNTHAKQTLMVPSLRVTATVHVCLCFSLLSPVEI